jgi:hypothetical protein
MRRFFSAAKPTETAKSVWIAPAHWRAPDQAPARTHAPRRRDRRDLRRWLLQTGIM